MSFGIGGRGVVQILPGEHQGLAVVALEAEEAVGQGSYPFSSSRETVRNSPLDLLILPVEVFRWWTWNHWGHQGWPR